MDTQPLLLTLAIAGLALGAGLVARWFYGRWSRPLPYTRVERLYRPTEPSFPGQLLERVLGDGYYVLSKVNLVNLIQPRAGLSNRQYAAALEGVYDRKVDFAVCDQRSREIVGVIEVEQAAFGHRLQKRGDKFLSAALAAAGIPVARVRARKSYAIEEVRQEIMSALVLA